MHIRDRESNRQGSWKFGEDFFFHLQTMYIHFGIKIYRSGRLHEDEEGARVFPVNNILQRTKELLHLYFAKC